MKAMINQVSRFSMNRSLGLLLIRIAVGLVFFMHGWMKIHNTEMVEGMFVGFGLPSATALFISWLEVIGGAAMILGLFTRVFGFLFAIEMIFAVYYTGFFASGYQKHELEIFLMLVSLGVALAGSGRYSAYPMECHDCGGMMCEGRDCGKDAKAKVV